MGGIRPATALTPEQVADLRGSGLTDETIAAAGLYCEHNGDRVRELLGGYMSVATAYKLGPCLVFPFHDAEGKPLTWLRRDGDGNKTPHPFVRLKPAKPRKNPDGKSIKYESPLKSGNHVYLPPGVGATLGRSRERGR